jgi:hypothetical protein
MFERIRKCRCQKWESEKVRNLHIFVVFDMTCMWYFLIEQQGSLVAL